MVITGWGIRPTATAIAGNATPTMNGQHQAGPLPKPAALKACWSVRPGGSSACTYLPGNPDTQVWLMSTPPCTTARAAICSARLPTED
jgi:hypothetical protein